MSDRPNECCGVCPETGSGGYDCTCRYNPRCPKYMGTTGITRGSVWVRKKDGQETTVLGIPDLSSTRPYVAHQAKRLTHTEVSNFLRKYTRKESSNE